MAAASFVAAAPATAASTLTAPPCVGYQGNVTTLSVEGAGYTPGAFISLRYEAPRLGERRSAALVTADGTGAFSTDLVPPSPGSRDSETARYTLRAVDPLRPEVDVATTFAVTRVRLSVRPRTSTDPGRRALFEAEDFEPGAAVYAHFRRFGGGGERTVRLGRAGGDCGQVSKRMALVPGSRVTPGPWLLYVDTERTFSQSTKPQAREQIVIKRRR